MIDLESTHDATARLEAHRRVDELAEWSGWASWDEAPSHAPRLPGVYLLRERDTGRIRYVGMVGDRAGAGRPQGLRGRLSAYRTGAGPVSGVGEAALDLALADPEWVAARLQRLRGGTAARTRDWVRDAIVRLAPEVRWSACHERADARHLETQVLSLLRPFGLWNR